MGSSGAVNGECAACNNNAILDEDTLASNYWPMAVIRVMQCMYKQVLLDQDKDGSCWDECICVCCQ